MAWTLYCSYNPAHWAGYDGFKGDEYIPLRSFHKRSREDTRAFIIRFTEGLAELSNYYASITNPTVASALSDEELRWLTKIHHTGNIANFLPLLVAARLRRVDKTVNEDEYIALLRALECYAYRVFLHKGRRSNAGRTSFFRWSYELFNTKQPADKIIEWVHGLTRYYAPEEHFLADNATPANWYRTRNCLKYTLFEYELHLLATEGHDKKPHLAWEQLSDSTIEHILPQVPRARSYWKRVWPAKKMEQCVHDIGNLVLTHDNASYSNFEFVDKKGKAGVSPSYSNSDIRQERRIAAFDDWTPKEFERRRGELIAWINTRWKTEGRQIEVELETVDEADEDELTAQLEAAPL